MTKKSKTIIFFGNERLATGVTTSCPIVNSLLTNGYNIAAIISNYSIATPSRKTRMLEIESIAKKNNIPIFFPNKSEEILDIVKKYNPDIGILSAYGKIISQETIDEFPFGIINIHPSDLPLHRGPTPIESVILDGSSQTAVSIMQLSKQMDKGAIIAKQSISLRKNENKQDLTDTLADIGKELILKILPKILSRDIKATLQDDSLATYSKLIEKRHGIIDTSKPADLIGREIKAYSGWPKSQITISGVALIVTKAHVSKCINSALDLKCANSTILSIDEVIAPSGRKMLSQDFLNGHNLK